MPTQSNVDPSLLRPNPWNTNHVSPDNETKIVNSLREFGMFKPIIVRTVAGEAGYEILGGQHRWEIALAEGHETVPIFDLGEIDDIKAKKITLADNARYGVDDTLGLAKILEEIGSTEDVQSILPYSDADLRSIFSSADIALDELELPESFEEDAGPAEAPSAKAPKTHTIMRFKVSLADAERLTELLTKIQKRQGYSASDQLTNAGDALVFAVMGGSET